MATLGLARARSNELLSIFGFCRKGGDGIVWSKFVGIAWVLPGSGGWEQPMTVPLVAIIAWRWWHTTYPRENADHDPPAHFGLLVRDRYPDGGPQPCAKR